MLMNMPGGTRPLHSISPGLYPPGDVGDGEAVHSATGHLSPATAWCQCGQSVDTDRGPGPGDPVHSVSNVWPGPGQCGLCCGAVVVMLSGQPGRPGRDQSSSLSLLSPPDLRQEGLWPVAARTAQNVPVCTLGKQEDARQKCSGKHTRQSYLPRVRISSR